MTLNIVLITTLGVQTKQENNSMSIKNPTIDPSWNETKFTEAIRDCIAYLGGYSIKLAASMFSAKGTPDAVYFLNGVTFHLESKVHPFKASPLQLKQISLIRETGCLAWICMLKNGIIYLDNKEFTDIETMIRYCHEQHKLIQLRPREVSGTV